MMRHNRRSTRSFRRHCDCTSELNIMADRRGGRMDFLGWGLLLAGLLVAVSVFSHHAVIAFPPRPESSNLLGPPGAWLAQQLYETLGSAVYVLLASWFALVLVLLGSKRLTLVVRLLGWVLLLPCATVIADFVGTDYLDGPLSGSGGTVGAFLADWLPEQFGVLGGLLVLGGCCSLGLVLALDFVLRAIWRAARTGTIFTGRGLGGIGRALLWLHTRTSSRRPAPIEIRHMGEPIPEADGEAVAESPQDINGIPIRHAEGSDPEIPAVVPPPRILPINRPMPVPDEERFADFELPPLTLLGEPEPFPYDEHDQQLRDKAALLEKTFRDFALNVRVVGINTGPVITQYEVALRPACASTR
jgi:S-DNA-T family DNA segregation ATPase FtsK/SpoIIIE